MCTWVVYIVVWLWLGAMTDTVGGAIMGGAAGTGNIILFGPTEPLHTIPKVCDFGLARSSDLSSIEVGPMRSRRLNVPTPPRSL